ncbi:DinB family protein [Radiobacillus deserti]|uniref:DinB family protein n=1 Tax=Radiobacillus deserti TaxID=2594883 RepID=A0A516KG67_9BACI|nr:DinB family protein [Radiobacillus deserti]QDP40359.1 DinB family protein [Radiobacillus deserti]
MISSLEIYKKQRMYSWNKEGWFVPLSLSLEGLGATDAAWKPPQGGNTIWQMVNHMNYWNERILLGLNGKSYVSNLPNEDTFGDPGHAEDTSGWSDTLKRTHRIANEIEKMLDELTEEELQVLPVYKDLSEWMMHDAYHTGQIVLLRKLQGSWPMKRG